MESNSNRRCPMQKQSCLNKVHEYQISKKMLLVLKSLLIFAIFRPICGCSINPEPDKDTTATTTPATIRKTTTTTTTTSTITTTKLLPPRQSTTAKITTLATTTKVPVFNLDDAYVNCRESEALHSFQVSILNNTYIHALRT